MSTSAAAANVAGNDTGNMRGRRLNKNTACRRLVTNHPKVRQAIERTVNDLRDSYSREFEEDKHLVSSIRFRLLGMIFNEMLEAREFAMVDDLIRACDTKAVEATFDGLVQMMTHSQRREVEALAVKVATNTCRLVVSDMPSVLEARKAALGVKMNNKDKKDKEKKRKREEKEDAAAAAAAVAAPAAPAAHDMPEGVAHDADADADALAGPNSAPSSLISPHELEVINEAKRVARDYFLLPTLGRKFFQCFLSS